MIRIEKAEVLTGYWVRLTLTDGAVIERNLQDELALPLFSALLDNPDLFAQVRVEAGTLVWPNGLDLCHDKVIWGGAPPADSSVRAS